MCNLGSMSGCTATRSGESRIPRRKRSDATWTQGCAELGDATQHPLSAGGRHSKSNEARSTGHHPSSEQYTKATAMIVVRRRQRRTVASLGGRCFWATLRSRQRNPSPGSGSRCAKSTRCSHTKHTMFDVSVFPSFFLLTLAPSPCRLWPCFLRHLIALSAPVSCISLLFLCGAVACLCLLVLCCVRHCANVNPTLLLNFRSQNEHKL